MEVCFKFYKTDWKCAWKGRFFNSLWHSFYNWKL